MALRDDLRATYDRARQQHMDEATALTLVFNRHLRGTFQARIKAAGNETVSDILNELDAEYRVFAADAGLPLDFFADAIRDQYPGVHALWQR